MKVVVRGLPFHWTEEDGIKLVPKIARVKAPTPPKFCAGDNDETVGTGLPPPDLPHPDRISNPIPENTAVQVIRINCPKRD
jgi:hypothetical protein